MGKLFGTDGIRGIAGQTLTAELAFHVGQAVAAVLTEEKGSRPLITIGKDTRISSDMLEAALMAGICSVGGDVMPLGTIPTPAVAFLTVQQQADAGIVISASHNPYAYNGIKVFNAQGYKLSDEMEQRVEDLILNHAELPASVDGAVGRRHHGMHALHSAYVQHLLGSIDCDLTGLRVLVRQGEKSKTLEAPLPLPVEQGGETPEFALASLTYDLLRSWTGIRPPWGKMTGVRPVRLIHDKRAAGWSAEQIDRFFLQRFDCSEKKYEMAKEIADLQEPILRLGSAPKTYSLYIGIPFCPSRCSYCSFVSCNLDRDRKLVQPYVDCLCKEVAEIRAQAECAGLTLCSIYIGGGTPTSLSAAQLRQLMGTVRENFDLSKVVEYTVEAGRPDCTDAEKLAVIKEYGATRISINPQTFSDAVLANIGRKHSAQDILDCYADARRAGHEDINMDLIAGLPGDTVEGFEHSLRQAIALQPENITVHTLTLKRASRIVIEDQKENDYADVAAMLEKCHLLAEAGYRPYYLYRQKNTLQNLENVGWCKPGHEGYYNIYIMEEVQTILSAGAGGSTKLVADGGKRMQRIFNFKYPNEYIQRFAEVLERKKGVAEFYDHNLGTETTG